MVFQLSHFIKQSIVQKGEKNHLLIFGNTWCLQSLSLSVLWSELLTLVISFRRRYEQTEKTFCTFLEMHVAQRMYHCQLCDYNLIFICITKFHNLKGPTLERSHMPAQNVTRYLLKVVIWRNMNRPTLKRSHLPAQYVIMHLLIVILWRHMERSHLSAQNVSHLPKVVMWQYYMKGPKLEKSHLPTQIVTRHLPLMANWRGMKGPMLEKSHLPAQNVTKHLLMMVIWRHMKGSHWRKASCVYNVWQFIYWKWCFVGAWKEPHWREAIWLLKMW